MNQQCKVCGEPAAGFHFGAFTCEGCKSFFGRTYNNLSSISECKNNRDCIINKKNRTSCKACRLRKCLLVGMSKSGSRFGRRSNWFKIHCLLQEQQHQHTNQLQLQQQQQQEQRQHDSSSPLDYDDQDDAKMKVMESEVSLPKNHHEQSASTNQFLANLKVERKRKKSSSDSGASSTDPDYIPARTASCDTSSNHHQQHYIRRLIDASFISPNAITASTNAHSLHSALPPYLLASSRSAHHLSAFLDTSHEEMQSSRIPMLSKSPSSLRSTVPFNLLVQNEPMDLSVKSTKKTKRSAVQRALPTYITSDRTSDSSSNSSSSNQILDTATKPVPLDLTL